MGPSIPIGSRRINVSVNSQVRLSTIGLDLGGFVTKTPLDLRHRIMGCFPHVLGYIVSGVDDSFG
jgi:hypothetical protein